MNKALFLDRDGVINKEINHLHKIDDVEFIDGIFELCQYFQKKGYLIIVVTNQAGIGRGYYTEKDFRELSDWMVDQFQKKGIGISKIYHCPYHPTEGVGRYKKDSFDRKPNPGMILKARDEFQLDLKSSVLVGDKESDIEAGVNAHVGTNVLFVCNEILNQVTKADFVISSLRELPEIMTS